MVIVAVISRQLPGGATGSCHETDKTENSNTLLDYLSGNYDSGTTRAGGYRSEGQGRGGEFKRRRMDSKSTSTSVSLTRDDDEQVLVCPPE